MRIGPHHPAASESCGIWEFGVTVGARSFPLFLNNLKVPLVSDLDIRYGPNRRPTNFTIVALSTAAENVP